MKKQLYTSKVFWIQIVIWLSLFLMPMMYDAPHGLITWQGHFSRCVAPLFMMVVVYLNYFLLAPMLLRGRKKDFWTYNALLVLALAIGQHEWLYHTWTSRHVMMFPYQILPQDRPKELSTRLFFIIRNIFNLSVCAGVGTSALMARRWFTAEKDKREAETAMTKAELVNLRQQVNPHFLLNTMNNIYALISFDTQKAQKAIIDLSNMLRHVLYDYQQPFVSLAEEVEFVHNYVELMVIRMPAKVEIKRECHIPDPCFIHVAPMIFISLLENAFKHGISPTRKSFIHMRLNADNERIMFTIENSNFPKDQKDRSGHGIGLKQVERRLELAYPGKYEWRKGVDPVTNTYSSKIIIYDTKLRNH
ncbi:MAG: histidine kinase [Prevotella sp.]|nr:histidine kinase [Prevotella sp.]